MSLQTPGAKSVASAGQSTRGHNAAQAPDFQHGKHIPRIEVKQMHLRHAYRPLGWVEFRTAVLLLAKQLVRAQPGVADRWSGQAR